MQDALALLDGLMSVSAVRAIDETDPVEGVVVGDGATGAELHGRLPQPFLATRSPSPDSDSGTSRIVGKATTDAADDPTNHFLSVARLTAERARAVKVPP